MKFKVFETFSGIGAQNAALQNLDKKIGFEFEIIGTSDWDIYSVLTYASMHHPFFEKMNDPTEQETKDFLNKNNFSFDGKKESFFNNVSDKQISRVYKAFKVSKNIGSIVDSFDRVSKISNDKSGIDLLTYSFPCQDLSSAGNFHGFNEGIKKHTRSGLLFEIEKTLESFKKYDLPMPRYLLLENVVNLVQKTHKKDFDIWLEKLSKLGYKTKWSIINSHDFGLLQARKRVFALSVYDPDDINDWEIGVDNDLNDQLVQIYDNNEYSPKKQLNINKIFDFDNKYFEESELSQMKNTPSREMMFTKGRRLSEISYKNIATVTTKQDRWPNLGSIKFKNIRVDNKGVEYLERRFVTPRECFYLMGFNKIQFENAKKEMEISSVSKVSSRDKLYKQAGNSIAINSLEMIFYYINKIEKGK